ncbi:MAG: hypothetical protein ACSHX6_11350 [Akkermansiaceae bacterium]
MKFNNKTVQPPSGFALISTIMIMSLLMLLAVGMLSLSSVEVKNSSTGKAQAEAQANARMGLLIALGQIQDNLGPDARATATAAIHDTDPSTEEIDGVYNPHWLGAYKTIDPSNVDNSLLDPAALRTFSLANTDWLVSHPDSSTTLDPKSALTGETVTLAQFIKDPTITIPDGEDIDSLDPSTLTKAQAGLVNIENQLSSNSGRYAYWVADESMKARIDNLAAIDGSEVLDGTVVDADTQRQSNYEIIQGTNFTSLLPTYKDTPNELLKLITPNTLQSLGQNTGSTWENWSILNQDKFTNYSRSLPVDVANGRLKKDLTAYIKGTYTGLDNQPIIDPRFNIAATKAPNFDLIKQWANLATDHTTQQPVTAPNTASSGQQAALHPVLTQGAVLLKQAYIPKTPGTGKIETAFMFMPQIQLWNPHNVPLEAQDYIVQVGYNFILYMDAGVRNNDAFTWTNGKPYFSSWLAVSGQEPLPLHKPADNEDIVYQDNKRFFTFVIKAQAFKPGESLVFYAKPPTSGSNLSGVIYNLNPDADTDILENYDDEQQLNLLANEGSLDQFFYIIPPTEGTTTTVNVIKNIDSRSPIQTDPCFRSRAAASGIGNDEESNEVHLNLYTVDSSGKPSLIHALKKPQRNERYGHWRQSYIPALDNYLNASESPLADIQDNDALINIGTSMLASNFDVFKGGANMNKPPNAGQPHSFLNQWNVRSQESFSASNDWPSSLAASSWLNTFSFRTTDVFKSTWEGTINYFNNNSMDRLGGWWQSNANNMTFPFFDYPTGEFGPMSLGSFQHANLSLYGWQPNYAFGNAQAPTRFDRQEYKSATYDDLFDLSYVLNASTWDQYYLSTIPQSGTTFTDRMRLPNSRMNLSVSASETANLINDQGFDLSAAHVFINGGFNVNSTSVASWKAFLSGALGQNVKALEGGEDSNIATAAAMGRFLAPLLEEPEDVANDRLNTPFDEPQAWASTRTLNEAELAALSSRLVQEVKLRGPFLSLADFVNRRPQPDNSVSGDEQVYQEVLGTIQAAINKTTLQDQLINSHYYNSSYLGKHTIKPAEDWSPLDFSVDNSATEAMFGYPISTINNEGGLIQNYSPGFLSQADVLTKIGPSITVRGDTFTIRSYGDSVDSSGKVLAKAWCEAVVQRVAEPMDWDGTEAKLIQPTQANESGFGRRFIIISFRWLNIKDVQPFTNDASIL